MQPGQDLVQQGVYDPTISGLEDFGVEDLKLPRLSIDHEKGGYVDSLTPGVAYEKIEVIPLGLIKQRVLWPALLSDDGGNKNPMCKSVDHQTGYPNTISTDPQEAFPWQAVGWNPNDFPKDNEGRTTLPCGSCRLQTWGSHPDGKKTWCSEQHAIVLLYGPEGSEPSMLALFTAQRSSINASKAFFGSIFRQQIPAFAVRAQWGLTAAMRGKNRYFIPTMVAVGQTDQGQWGVYQDNYLQVRGHITRPPRIKDEQQGNVNPTQLGQANVNAGFGNNTWTPGQQPGTIPGAVVQQQVPQQYVQQPAPQPAPVPQQPAVDPAYLEWQRQQAAQQAAAQAAAAQAAAQVVPTAPAPQAGAMPFQMDPPVPAVVQQPSSSLPVTPAGRDEDGDDALPF